MDPNALTIGFARRFTSYKRPNLLLHDPQRLSRLLNQTDRPVQLFIAGKAHPQDQKGKEMIKQWLDFMRWPQIQGKIFFIEDYDMTVAAQMTQGVDLWINTPRRPWEASGTSGMKVLVNGGINLSELDGWWAEAYCAEIGWAIGDGQEHDDDPLWDGVEAEQLYRCLEEEVIPEFYNRDQSGIPRDWVMRMRLSMARLTPQFSTNRMLRQYTDEFYIPAAQALRARQRDNGHLGREIEQWRDKINKHWANIHFGNLDISQEKEQLHFQVQLYLDDLSPQDVLIELYAAPQQPDSQPEHWPMTRKEKLTGAINGFIYSCTISTSRPASDYTPRVRPWHEQINTPLEDNHILWMRCFISP